MIDPNLVLRAIIVGGEVVLAFREDMTPDQRKAFWLWLERMQKLRIEDTPSQLRTKKGKKR